MIKKIFNKLFNKNQEAISFKQGIDLTDLPVITLYQGDNKFNFILDTGSDVNLIDSNILNKIEHNMYKGDTTLYGIEGQRTKSSACNMIMYYKDQKLNLDCMVKDLKDPFTIIKKDSGVTLHGLIGSIFFTKYKYILDFNEMIAYSKR